MSLFLTILEILFGVVGAALLIRPGKLVVRGIQVLAFHDFQAPVAEDPDGVGNLLLGDLPGRGDNGDLIA